MRLDIKANRRPVIVDFSVTTKAPRRIRIFAIDKERPLTKFTDRFVNLRGPRDFRIKVPQSPTDLSLFVSDVTGNSSGLVVSQAKVQYGTTCNAWMSNHARTFIRFAQEFCENSSYLPAGNYTSATGQFLIKYMPTIIDYKTGKRLNTPARIGHETGNIEVARDKWEKYTVPMRMIILLHEYSHKYMNHEVGRDINDEVAADINALYLYMGMGYPAIDARLVFAYVFYGNHTDLNKRRMNIIDDYISRFEKGEVVKGCS